MIIHCDFHLTNGWVHIDTMNPLPLLITIYLHYSLHGPAFAPGGGGVNKKVV